MDGRHEDRLRSIAVSAVDRAGRAGVKEVRAVVGQSRYVTLTYRGGKPDKVEEAVSRGLTLDLFSDGRFARCRTNDLRDDALARFVVDSAALCHATSPDECRFLPDPALYADREDRELRLFDATIDEAESAERHGQAADLEAAAVEAAGPRAVSIEASWADTASRAVHVQSDGFEGVRRSTRFWTWATVTLSDEGEKRPQGWAEAGARFRGDLADHRQVAAEAVESARGRLAATRLATEKLPMVVHHRAAGRLLGYLLRAASGAALHQKTSFLIGCLGQRVGSEVFQLVDDPFVVGGFGSRLFDGEGITSKKFPIVDGGVLRNYYVDTYYGRKLEMDPTTGSSSNLIIQPGRQDLPQLIAGMDRGVLVRGFVGGNCNGTTGDFSLGVYGTLIEQGALTRNVAELNIAGNMRDFWQRLMAVGSDPYPYSTYRIPSLVFDAVQFSGT